MREIMYGDETIKVLEATGCNNGYYWDLNAKIEFRGDTYSLFDAGSYTGCMPCCSGITKCDFDRLYGEEQEEIDEYDWDYLEDAIKQLVIAFIETGAKEKWEIQRNKDYYEDNNDHILVDGVEIK